MSTNKIFLFLKKAADAVDKVVDGIGSAAVVITIGSTSINIFSRWIIGRSLGELDELSLISFVWMIYIGMGRLYRSGEHICMDFIVRRLPKTARIVVVSIDAVIELAVGVFISYLAFRLMGRSWIRTTNVNHVPYALLQLSIAIGFALLALCVLIKVVKMYSAAAKKQDPFEGGES